MDDVIAPPLSTSKSATEQYLSPSSGGDPVLSATDRTIISPPDAHRSDEQGFTPNLDRMFRASMAHFTQGISPHAVAAAWFDWLSHFTRSPQRQMELLALAAANNMRLAGFATKTIPGQSPEPPFEARQRDHRFTDPAWRHHPFLLWQQSYLALEDWWVASTRDIRGMSRRDAQRVAFLTEQLLDFLSPSNCPLLNPVILREVQAQGGFNFARGFANFLEDVWRSAAGHLPNGTDAYQLGRDLAITPGQVIFRNELMELIQYAPATDLVFREPVLIVPAWIMKYYILDLRPENSLVRFLVERGHTVFMMSWRNPTEKQRDVSFDDYRTNGIMAALDAVNKIAPNAQTHLVGYCLGGTMSSIAAATMSRDGDERLQSLSLLAAQTDFGEAGDLMLFVDDSQVAFIEDLMWEQGVLDAHRMAVAFKMLRSNDLLWSKAMREYVLGARDKVNDLAAWSSDPTRMPYRMHSEYLRGLFLENRLTAGRFAVEGRVVALKDLKLPMFIVGTETDHIAPWRSVYKTSLFTDNELTFILTNGGHNAGIVSEPGHPGRAYKVSRRNPGDRYRDPDTWAVMADHRQGSWWSEWALWLALRSSPAQVPAPSMGSPEHGLSPLEPAPGTYVFER